MHVAMAYLNGQYLETLIEQLEQVCTSAKWHARQAAIESVQSMIFCNLFNARPYTKRLHELVLKCILGLCAIVLSSPYDIPTYLPDALMILCEHSYDPDPIQKSIKQCLSEFRRTHYDSWHEHQEKFTERQLLLLADAFISRSYYA
ncbi:unnamed protein product [Rotaria sordida]|uniref:Proteasome activator complex subunit 4 C-terminal domain-containing protein n=1 Tax=Rotaria sordida TaxID=392033 RepID=A0A814GVC4_9BILA|nr:unnamed protein product [Rotaria sordida]